MASKSKMKSKNKDSPTELPRWVDKELQKLECPFTWKMTIITIDHAARHLLLDEEIRFPLLHVMRLMMMVYMNTILRVEVDEVQQGLEKCIDTLMFFKETEHPEISADVVKYVVQCTTCFVLADLNMPRKQQRVYRDLKKNWRMNDLERSTLKACRGICWSMCEGAGAVAQAEHYLREAIRDNPNCALWHFVLGTILRRMRRDTQLADERPCKAEIKSFVRAYNMSANPLFGVFLGQLHREMRRFADAEKVYAKAFEEETKCHSVLLRLTYGYVRMKCYEKANDCLKRVSLECKSHAMYLHYRGIRYFNYRDIEAASDFLKVADKDDSITAEKQNLDCVVMLSTSFDVIQYLDDKVKNPDRVPDGETECLLDLALTYWIESKKNLLKSILVHCVPTGQYWLFMNEDDYNAGPK